jgi:hypothetical protein
MTLLGTCLRRVSREKKQKSKELRAYIFEKRERDKLKIFAGGLKLRKFNLFWLEKI